MKSKAELLAEVLALQSNTLYLDKQVSVKTRWSFRVVQYTFREYLNELIEYNQLEKAEQIITAIKAENTKDLVNALSEQTGILSSNETRGMQIYRQIGTKEIQNETIEIHRPYIPTECLTLPLHDRPFMRFEYQHITGTPVEAYREVVYTGTQDDALLLPDDIKPIVSDNKPPDVGTKINVTRVITPEMHDGGRYYPLITLSTNDVVTLDSSENCSLYYSPSAKQYYVRPSGPNVKILITYSIYTLDEGDSVAFDDIQVDIPQLIKDAFQNINFANNASRIRFRQLATSGYSTLQRLKLLTALFKANLTGTKQVLADNTSRLYCEMLKQGTGSLEQKCTLFMKFAILLGLKGIRIVGNKFNLFVEYDHTAKNGTYRLHLGPKFDYTCTIPNSNDVDMEEAQKPSLITNLMQDVLETPEEWNSHLNVQLSGMPEAQELLRIEALSKSARKNKLG